jgi:hypothetical protein
VTSGRRSRSTSPTPEIARTVVGAGDVSRREINRRYIPPAPGAKPFDTAPPGGRSHRMLRLLARPVPIGGQPLGSFADATRVMLLPFLFLFAVVLTVLLDLRLLGRRRPSGLHGDALEHVEPFIRQYPLHPYAVLAKSFELAYLLRQLPAHLEHAGRVVEVAIGDGTLSRQIFPPDARIVAADIAPYNLRFAAAMPHVHRAVVCDCLQPPLGEGSFDLLIANNFLHHVSAKHETLRSWTLIGKVVMFNENTTVWSSSWPKPFLLHAIGLHAASAAAAAAIEEAQFQDLESAETLDEMIAELGTVLGRESYFARRSFFLAGLFSALMRCTGPPTPNRLKRLLTGPLGWLAIPLTRRSAQNLIMYDALQERSNDAYISYTVESADWRASGPETYLCPDCRTELDGTRCPACGATFGEADGMYFLLPMSMRHIETEYDPAFARTLTSERL